MNNKSIKESISKQIQKFLNNSKMPKSTFGSLFGVTRTSVNRWINCVCAPDIELFPKLCEVMDITIFELLGLPLEDHLPSEISEVVNMYYSNMNFRYLIDKYRSDEPFRKEIDMMIDE